MKVAGIAILGSLALLIFKQYKPDWGIPVRLALGVVIGGMILTSAEALLAFGKTLSEENATVSGIWSLILKALGISFVTELALGICRDSGETALGVWVEMAGKMALILLALPMIQEILDTVRTLSGLGV